MGGVSSTVRSPLHISFMSSHDSSLTPSAADQDRQRAIAAATAVIVKVGTRVLTGPDGRLDRERIEILSGQLCRVADSGRQTVLVSSGAVGAGLGKLGLDRRPTGVAKLQAVAAIGQSHLIQAYEAALTRFGRHAAQVLLTAHDLRRRSGYLHVRNALLQIHALRAIAVINENDSVAVRELMTTFGDNDGLAAAVAGLLPAALLVILSDVDGLYDGPPDAASSRVIPTVRKLDSQIMALAQDRLGGLSKGGMASKLRAARIATSHGHHTIIAPGRDDRVLDRIFAGESVGTLFLPKEGPLRGRRRWIGSSAEVEGHIHVDAGAAHAVARQGRSLLAIGITGCEGDFTPGDVVALHDPQGLEIARGLTNYHAHEIRKIAGLPSDRITQVLGHCPYDVVIHRDNMAIDNRPTHQPPIRDDLA